MKTPEPFPPHVFPHPDWLSRIFFSFLPQRIAQAFYKQALKDGAAAGAPHVMLKLPFTFRSMYNGNAYDFTPDLSTVVYARPGGQADLYLLRQAQ